MNKILKKLRALKIKLLILDVDGVLTDGKIHYFDDGTEGKSFHAHDGLGIKLLMQSGIEVALISGKTSKATEKRARYLGIKHAYIGACDDKRACFAKLKKKLHIKDENIAYIGDDLPDVAIMKQVGFKIAVANAIKEVRDIADYVTNLKGGKGAVREACDLLIKAQA